MSTDYQQYSIENQAVVIATFHFGTLRNIYRLIGYTGNQGYWDKLTAYKRWVTLHLGNAAFDPSTECLRIDNAVNICFGVAKWRKYKGRPLRCTLRRRVRWPKGWVVALKLGENNESILDYVLLLSVPFISGPFFWFSEDTRPAHGIERFETFEELSRSLIKRVCKAARSTKTEPRSKAKGVAKSRKGRRL
jgi:hypothetical protein